MGQKNWRGPAVTPTKVKTMTTSTSTPAKTRSSTLPKIFVKVKICSHDGRVIKDEVDITAVRRFSKEARLQIPPYNTTTNQSEAVVEFKLPEYTGYSTVTDDAVIAVFQFMEQHKKDENLPRLDKGAINSEDLIYLVNVYALARALGVAFSVFPLEKQICEIVRSHPITAAELAACWELLDDSQDRIINTAVQSLTHFYAKRQIDPVENEAIEDYYKRDGDLKSLFDMEESRQIELRRGRKIANRKAREAKEGLDAGV